MTAVVDVGDAFELTFTSVANATVTVTLIDPGGDTDISDQTVEESSAGSGLYPVTLVMDEPGIWTALFTSTGAVTAVEPYYVRARTVTGPTPLATVGDVAGQFGQLTAAQEGVTAFLLRAASAMIRHHYPYVDVWLLAGRLDQELVSLAAANMVLRVLRNPNGLRAETVGPFSRTYDTSAAAGLLVLTAGEASLLTPGSSVTTSTALGGIGTIRVKAGLAPPRRTTWPYGFRRM